MKAAIAVPATLALVHRAWSHKSLTPLGIVTAAATAAAHAAHPWNLPFALLVVFFLAGTRATKVKKDLKATLTVSAQGSSGGEGPRTHVQVLANSLVASALALLHVYHLRQDTAGWKLSQSSSANDNVCFGMGRTDPVGDLLVVGIIANYAAVTADTFSSELGILARSEPRLITSLSLRKVPRGTNGGVTLWGLVAGLLGSVIVVTASILFLPVCGSSSGSAGWAVSDKLTLFGGLAVWGALGSLLDSFLGGWLQRSVRDARTGKIVEGEGGVRVLVTPSGVTSAAAVASGAAAGGGDPVPSIAVSSPTSSSFPSSGADRVDKRTAGLKARLVKGEGKAAVEKVNNDVFDHEEDGNKKNPYDSTDQHRRSSFGDNKPTRVVESGFDLLDNNQVNFLMALTMSVGAMAVAARYWEVPLGGLFRL